MKVSTIVFAALVAMLIAGPAQAQTYYDFGPALPAAPTTMPTQSVGSGPSPTMAPDGRYHLVSGKRYLLDPSVIRFEVKGAGISDATLRDLAAQAFEAAVARAGATVVPNDTSRDDAYVDKVAQSGRYDAGYDDTPRPGHYVPANYRIKTFIVSGGRSTDARFNRADAPDLPVVIDLDQEQVTLHVEITVERIGTAADSYTMTADSRRHHLQGKLLDIRNNAAVRVGGKSFSFNVLEKIAGIRQQQYSSSQVAITLVQDALNKDVVPQLAAQIQAE